MVVFLFVRFLNTIMKKTRNNDDNIETRNVFSKAERAAAPDAWGEIPEIAGCDYHTNAKIVQRLIDHPELRAKILGHITVNEMADEADDGTNFLNYTNDN
jgi:hypothetical protein